MRSDSKFSRRAILRGLVGAPVMVWDDSAATVMKGHGQVKPPILVPDLEVVRHDGVATRLHSVLSGKVTAVQLMFTECTTTCPMGAATFQRAQKLFPRMKAEGLQLLSLSIDPEDDSAVAMSAWRHHFHAGANWIAAAPRKDAVGRVKDFFQKGSDSSDHSTQVHIVDRNGWLVWRTYELPGAEEILGVLRIAAKNSR